MESGCREGVATAVRQHAAAGRALDGTGSEQSWERRTGVSGWGRLSQVSAALKEGQGRALSCAGAACPCLKDTTSEGVAGWWLVPALLAAIDLKIVQGVRKCWSQQHMHPSRATRSHANRWTGRQERAQRLRNRARSGPAPPGWFLWTSKRDWRVSNPLRPPISVCVSSRLGLWPVGWTPVNGWSRFSHSLFWFSALTFCLA